MQWIRDTNADNAILEACNEWDNFKGKVITFLSTFVVYAQYMFNALTLISALQQGHGYYESDSPVTHLGLDW